MTRDEGSDTTPEFDDVFPDLDVAGRLLAAIAREDQQAVDELRERADAN